MGVCIPCRNTKEYIGDDDLRTDECSKPNSSHGARIKPKSNAHNSFPHLDADPRDGQIIVSYNEAKCSKKPLRWGTYNSVKQQKEVPQVKHMTEKSGIIEEEKEDGKTRKDMDVVKNNFVHFKTTIGVGRSQMIRTLNIDTSSNSVPIITLDPSNLVLENKGKIKDTYKIISLIGRGAFGDVHKIMHLTTKKIYAMKTINKTNYEESADCLNEIKILKSLVISYFH